MSKEFRNIIEKINLANNGRLLLSCFDEEEKQVVEKMKNVGIVFPAQFNGWPAVRLAKQYQKWGY